MNLVKLLKDSGLSESKLLETLQSLKVSSEKERDSLMIEVTPDRPDLLGEKGLAYALKAYLGQANPRENTYYDDTPIYQDASTEKYRGYFQGFFVSGLYLDDDDVEAIMNFQELLHKTYCRNRAKASIGIHDASGITSIKYVTGKVDQVEFTPLGGSAAMKAIDVIRKTEKGREYSNLVNSDEGLFVMSNKGVMSMPPIINSEATRVTKFTKKIFVDVEGTDNRTVKLVTAVLARELSGYGAIGLTKIRSHEGEILCPDLSRKTVKIKIKIINNTIGTKLKPEELKLALMRLDYSVNVIGDEVLAEVPYYRFDVLGLPDVIEDAMIGIGLHSIPPSLPNGFTIGGRSPISKLKDKARDEMASLGFIEVSMTVLSDGIKQKEVYDLNPIRVSNPVSTSYDSLRIGLLPDLLKALSANKKKGMPLRFFEVGPVIEPKDSEAIQKLNLAAVFSDYSASLENLQGDLIRVAQDLKIDLRIRSQDLPFALMGRSAVFDSGWVAEISPRILLENGFEFPVVAFEITLAKQFVTKLKYTDR
ncbi:MAG: phenylalanine--tRNA ligase subunit beta [Thermoprotei archaeon]